MKVSFGYFAACNSYSMRFTRKLPFGKLQSFISDWHLKSEAPSVFVSNTRLTSKAQGSYTLIKTMCSLITELYKQFEQVNELSVLHK